MFIEKKTQIDWDLWWLRLAKQYATGSKDPSTKCGALIVVNNRLRSAGYNNFPSSMFDDKTAYYCRDEKLQKIVHAEIAAIEDFIANYSYEMGNAILYIYPLFPCYDCAKYIADSGLIERVVSTDYTPIEWSESLKIAKQLFSDNSIQHLEYKITCL